MVKMPDNLLNRRGGHLIRLISILGLVLTFLIGVSLTQVRPVVEWVRPSERLSPNFSREEAAAVVGHHVRCIYRTNRMSGGCEIGQRGEVTGMEKVSEGGYFIIVHWNGRNADEQSYYGRYSHRLFIAEE
jgi:hypothetical protein